VAPDPRDNLRAAAIVLLLAGVCWFAIYGIVQFVLHTM
jgi:hypothetical protein